MAVILGYLVTFKATTPLKTMKISTLAKKNTLVVRQM